MLKWLKSLFIKNDDHMTLSSTQDHPNAISADDAHRFNVQHNMELDHAYLERESGYLDIVFERIKETAKNGGRRILIKNSNLSPNSNCIIIPQPDYMYFIRHRAEYFKRKGFCFEVYPVCNAPVGSSRYIEISW